MKKSQRRTGELDDTDIGSLFNQQSLEPPKSIDIAILAAAQNAVEQGPEFAEDELAGPPHKYTMWYQLAASAAVLVLAITLVPTLTQTPEYKRENSPAAVRRTALVDVEMPVLHSPSPMASQPTSAPAWQAEAEAAVLDSAAADKAYRENLAAPVTERKRGRVEARSEQKAEAAAGVAAPHNRAAAVDNVQEAQTVAGSLDVVEENVQGAASVMADSNEPTGGAAGKVDFEDTVRKAEASAETTARTMKKSRVPVADHAPKMIPMRQAAPESLVDTYQTDSKINAPITSGFSSGLSESESMGSKDNITKIEADGDVILVDIERRLQIHAQEAFRQSPMKWTKEIIRLHNADNIEDSIREYVLFKKMYPELAGDSRFPKQLRKLAK